MFSREIIHMYRTGATDPRALLAMLMKEAYENPSDDEDGDLAIKLQRPKLPNLTCFKDKKKRIRGEEAPN